MNKNSNNSAAQTVIVDKNIEITKDIITSEAENVYCIIELPIIAK